MLPGNEAEMGATLRFGDVKVETKGKPHLDQVHVHLNDEGVIHETG
jgi:hypothetical protein